MANLRICTNTNGGYINLSGTPYVNPTTGTRRICLRTGTGTGDIVRYGLTTNTSAANYCGMRMYIDGHTAYIGKSWTGSNTYTTSMPQTLSTKSHTSSESSTYTTSIPQTLSTVSSSITKTYTTSTPKTLSTASNSSAKTYTTSTSKTLSTASSSSVRTYTTSTSKTLSTASSSSVRTYSTNYSSTKTLAVTFKYTLPSASLIHQTSSITFASTYSGISQSYLINNSTWKTYQQNTLSTGSNTLATYVSVTITGYAATQRELTTPVVSYGSTLFHTWYTLFTVSTHAFGSYSTTRTETKIISRTYTGSSTLRTASSSKTTSIGTSKISTLRTVSSSKTASTITTKTSTLRTASSSKTTSTGLTKTSTLSTASSSKTTSTRTVKTSVWTHSTASSSKTASAQTTKSSKWTTGNFNL